MSPRAASLEVRADFLDPRQGPLHGAWSAPRGGAGGAAGGPQRRSKASVRTSARSWSQWRPVHQNPSTRNPTRGPQDVQ
eukprot:2019397-Pyramimonas_sp.AAC.1